jgi:transposase
MATYKYNVTLSQEERNQLTEITRTGTHGAREITHALILLDVDRGPFNDKIQANAEISKALKISTRTVDRVKKRFFEQGLDAALKRKPTTRVYQHLVDGQAEARLVVLACSNPPAGYASWSMRLLADKAVELHLVDSISYRTVHRVLKKK